MSNKDRNFEFLILMNKTLWMLNINLYSYFSNKFKRNNENLLKKDVLTLVKNSWVHYKEV